MRSTVVVIGAGIIGAAVGWRCAQRGFAVTLVDPHPERGAWHTAAGMLSPVTELHYGEEALYRLGSESLTRFPQFCAELAERTGIDPHLTTCGTLSTAWDAADLAGLRDLHAYGATIGAHTQFLTGSELRDLEPLLAPGLTGGVLAPGDHIVEPRRMHAALLAADAAAGATLTVSAARVRISGDRAVGVEIDDGSFLTADHVVLAAGAWSGALDGLPPERRPPVRPVKGQTLLLRPATAPVLSHVVRASIKGAPVYLVPRDNGDVVVGASVEEVGFDDRPRAGAVYDLLRDAQTAVPELGEAALVEVNTGFRPGSPDNAPILGPSGIEGLTFACGHYRNGVLLAPVTADAIADCLDTGSVPEQIAGFGVARFAGVAG